MMIREKLEKRFGIKLSDKRLQIIVLITCFCLAISLSMGAKSSDKGTEITNSKFESADTFIPAGFVLVPIEIQNFETVDSLLGSYGVVDLYSSQSKRPVKSGVRIIRSPLDPTQFAVLISETEAAIVVNAAFEPLRVVLQNPKSGKIDSFPNPIKRKITYK